MARPALVLSKVIEMAKKTSSRSTTQNNSLDPAGEQISSPKVSKRSSSGATRRSANYVAEETGATAVTKDELEPGWRIEMPTIDDNERFVEWWDLNLDTPHWFSMVAVDPQKAAMLLCGFNPNEICFEDAMNWKSPELPFGVLRNLEQQFQAEKIERTDDSLTLLQWIEIAQARGLKTHPWIERYLMLCPKHGLGKPRSNRAGTLHKKGSRWTDEEERHLYETHQKIRTKATAKLYGISVQLVRKIVSRVKGKNPTLAHKKTALWASLGATGKL